jgi:hypothetical protein
MSPLLAIARIDVIPQEGDLYHVVVQLENQGFLPTYTSKKALERDAVRPIEVSLSLPEKVSLISGRQWQEVGHLEGRSNKAFTRLAEAGTDYRCHLEWVVKAPTPSEIEIVAKAERAGTVRQQILLNGEFNSNNSPDKISRE